MKKLALGLLSFFLLVGVFVSPLSAFAQDEPQVEGTKVEQVSSFDLFWPIVAGKTSGDSLYFAKTLKESVREMLIFSKYRKTDYNITLTEKRAVELEKLLQNKDFANAEKTLEMSKSKRLNVLSLLKQLADEGTNTTDLKTTFMNSLKDQEMLFKYLLTTASDDKAKEIINSFLSSLQSDLSSLK